jgi:hypothetical protein
MEQLLDARPESSPRAAAELKGAVPAAAMAVIRLEELGQDHAPVARSLLNLILATQESDGGWSDPMVTALCLRALLCGRGRGVAIERGMAHLAELQRDDGSWPAIPVRRAGGDAMTTAFILQQLADQPAFAARAQVEMAMGWLGEREAQLDGDARRLWSAARVKYQFLPLAA